MLAAEAEVIDRVNLTLVDRFAVALASNSQLPVVVSTVQIELFGVGEKAVLQMFKGGKFCVNWKSFFPGRLKISKHFFYQL